MPNNPNELMLGVFWASDEDNSDTLYVSFNGTDFHSIGTAYQDSAPTDSNNAIITDSPSLSPRPNSLDSLWTVYPLHDPGLIYKDGTFWMISRYEYYSDTLGTTEFAPMLGYSQDLIHWSYPNSGHNDSNNDHNVLPTVLPLSKDGSRTNTHYDSVAPDMLLDDDGSVWIVVSFGYYAAIHGDSGLNDQMSPYLIKATGLTPGSNPVTTRDDKMQYPKVTYSDAVPINLPGNCNNLIDGSLYKENGKYYLNIKKNGVTNEIWSIDNLADCQDSSKWSLVCDNVVTGFEGPCLTKYNNSYYFYTDKLGDYPHDNPDGKRGIFVSQSLGINQPWSKNTRVTATDVHGNALSIRHGTVLTVTDPAAISLIMQRYHDAGYTYNPNTDTPTPYKPNGWYYANNNTYWYDNGVLAKNKEHYDSSTNAWYWFQSDGSMAVNKDIFIPYNDSGSNGKLVRYDSQGKMIKGENFHDNGWYLYDTETGELCKGFKNIPDGSQDGKWVYYDETTGAMHHGESFINNNWYRFDQWTGKMVHGEYCDPNGNWYYYDSDYGTMKKGFTNIADGSPNGKTVYYDETTGIMHHGESYINGGWYWFDHNTGAMAKGFLNIPDGSPNGKWVYYDENTGAMHHGESFINNNWYRFDNTTGKMVHGEYCDANGNWYYYDSDYGTMKKGFTNIADGSTNGKTVYYDETTGIMQHGAVYINGTLHHFDNSTGAMID